MGCFLKSFAFLASFNMLAGNLPGIAPPLSRLGGLLILAVWSAAYLRCGTPGGRRVFYAAVCLPLCAALMLSESLVLPGIGFFIAFLIFRVREKDSPAAGELCIYLRAVLLYTLFRMLYVYSPLVWYGLQEMSLLYTEVLSACRVPMTLGPSAAGAAISISAVCLGLGLVRRQKKVRAVFYALALPFLANAAFLCLLKPLARLVRLINESAEPGPLELQGVLILLSAAFLYPLCRTGGRTSLSFSIPKAARLPAAVAAFFFCGAIAVLSFSGGGPRNSGAVVFVDKGTDWRVPVYGKVFGKNSPGMFGLLSHYLELRGTETRKTRDLTESALRGAAVVAVFNPAQKFSADEKRRLLDFVKSGGGLLVAGDHTDVSGIMDPINDILEPFDIWLKFDTALPAKTGWIDCLELRPHPVVAGLERDYEAGIWVGASLAVKPPARPVIVGKYGWADWGDYRNRKRAYLGNYRREPDEQLGDVVLAASDVLGKGRVLVFGDTSGFQNGSLPLTHGLINRVFGWLMMQDAGRSRPLWRLGAALALLLPAGFMLIRRPSVALLVVLIAAAPIGPRAARFFSGPDPGPVHREPLPSAQYRAALIDHGHTGRFAPLANDDDSVWGLALNLMRNRYMPLLVKQVRPADLQTAALYVTVAPVRSFSAEEVRRLKAFMQRGGKVIWAAGWEDLEGSRAFLDEFGITIDNVPLGSAEIKVKGGTIRFFEAWPVVGDEKSVKVMAEKWGHPLIVYQKVGRGGLMVIGDSGFLLSKNIESYKTYRYGNIRFLKFLLHQIED